MAIILLYRIGANLYVPYIDVTSVQSLASMYEGSIFQFVSLLSGDAFSKATLFALSVTPYITASIVMQLLTIALPPLEKLSKHKIVVVFTLVSLAFCVLAWFGR